VIWRASYKVWGNTVKEEWQAVSMSGSALPKQTQDPASHPRPEKLEQNLRFQGQYLDRSTGLHYNTFRYYDPDIGRLELELTQEIFHCDALQHTA
jgi:RHS repeat-associated protein